MAKLSDTYKIKESQTVVNGGGNSAPVSYGGKLSDRYVLGANAYQAPDVEFKQVPTLAQPSTVSMPSIPSTPSVETTQNNKGGLLNTIKNLFSNSTPSIPKVGQTTSTALMDKTKAKIDTQNYQQNLRNQELAKFDAQDKSNVVFTGKNGNNITRDKINLWLQPGYELSKEEKKQIKELVNDTTNVANYQKYFGGMDINDAAKLQQDISRLEQRTSGALGYGFAEGVPGFKTAENVAANLLDKANGNTNVSDAFKADQAATQSTGAYKVGRGGSKVLQYYGLGKSGVLNPLADKLGKALIPKLGEQLGGHLANILADQVADVILDTAPEMVDNISAGMSAKDVASGVVQNLKENLEFNLIGEYGPEVIKAINNNLFKKSVEEVAEEVIVPAVKNGPTEIEKEAEALRRARSVDVLPTIEPTELEKEAQALKNARTAELVPSAIKELEVPTVAKEAETVAKEVAPAVKQTEVPTVVKKATPKKTAQKYTQDEIDDIQSYKNYRDRLLRLSQLNADNPQLTFSTIDTINRMDDEMWQKYPELFDEGNFKGVPTLNTVKDNLVMAEDAGLNDEISELVAPVEIKADAPKIPEGVELPKLEVEDGPVSQFMTGSTKTVTDPKTYEEVYKPIEDLNRHIIKSADYIDMVSDARLLTNGVIDPKKVDEWKKALSYADNLSMEDVATAFDIKAYLEETKQTEALQDFWSRVRPHITNDAQVLNYLSQLKRNTVDGAIEGALGKLRKDVDKHFGKKGFSDAINNFTRQVEDAIKSGNTDDVEKLFNKKLSDFGYGKEAKTRLKSTTVKGEKKVLDIIKKAKSGTPEEEIAKEVSSAIRRLNGVADISIEDELEIKRLLTEASQYSKDSRQFKELRSQAAKIIDDKTPVTFANKFKTYLYDNMLGNLKTGLTRNAGGNTISNTLEGLQKPLKVGIDKLTSLKTGQRNYILSPKVSAAYAEGFKKGLKDQTLDILHKTPTTRSGEDSFADAIAAVKRTYKGKNIISKGLNAYDSTVKNVMSYGDRPYYEGAFAATKAELNEIAEKYGKDAISQVGVPKEALDSLDDTIEFLARERALEAVFQKGSLSAEAFTEMKEALGKMSKDFIGIDVLSQFSMPFIQVPANMMSRLADYLPGVGTIKNAANSFIESKYGGGFNQRRFVDATSRNLTGLGLFGGGVALANNAKKGGAGITGGLSDDADKAAAQRNAGEQEYALKLPSGREVDISDLPTIGPMAKASSSFYEALDKNQGSLAQGLTDATAQALSSVMETSTLQGLNRLFGTNEYGNGGGFGENVKNVIGAGLGQMLPSLERQATQVIDPYKRDLGEYGTPTYYLNNLINGTPFRMSLLNPKLDNEGNYIEQNQGRSTGMKVLENMILPWTITDPEYTKLGEAANKIYEKSSDHTTKAYPTVPSRSKAKEWLGDRYDNQSYYDLKELAGRYNTRIGGYIVGTRFFKDLSPDDQADVMSSINTAITALVRERAERGYENKNTLAKKYKEGGIEAMLEYLKSKYSKEIPTLK